MKQHDIIKRSSAPMDGMVCLVTDGGVKLRMIPASGPYTYRNEEVYSVDLLTHFGWRVVGAIGKGGEG